MVGDSGTTIQLKIGQEIAKTYLMQWSSIAITTTRDTPKIVEDLTKRFSGKCRFCGKWQSGLVYHEEKVCPKRFRR
jgi:hypothetical protein